MNGVGEGAVWAERREILACVCVSVWGEGGVARKKGCNRSHWNVEMCVCKRPVNSCLK